MQASSLRTNQLIVKESPPRDKKSLETPNSPLGVVDGERIFSGRQIGGDNGMLNPTVTCGCFQFWDFFQRSDKHGESSFNTRLGLNDIQPVSEEQMYAPATGLHRTPQNDPRMIDERSAIDDNAIACDEILLPLQVHEKTNGTIPIANDLIEDEQQQQQQQPIFNDCNQVENETSPNYNNEHTIHQIILSFSPSTFSEGDRNNNDMDNETRNNQNHHNIPERKLSYEEDKNSDGSSSLSFDENEFEEKEFESDYGLVEVERNKNDYFTDPRREDYLPTIFEDHIGKSFSCDVGSGFNNIFICNR